MNAKQKNQFRQVIDLLFRVKVQEILEKKISSYNSGSHIVLSPRHRGKKAKVIIYK